MRGYNFLVRSIAESDVGLNHAFLFNLKEAKAIAKKTGLKVFTIREYPEKHIAKLKAVNENLRKLTEPVWDERNSEEPK
jgi:hypothetical protein